MAVLLILATVSLEAQLVNPGFEADLLGSSTVTGWTNGTPENGSAQVSSVNARSGSRSLAYTILSGGASGEMRSSRVTIPQGSYVRVTAWVAASANLTRVQIGVKGAVDKTSYFTVGTGLTKFEFVSDSTLSSAGTVYGCLFSSPSANGGKVFWDDVVIYPSNNKNYGDAEAPLPAGAVTVNSITSSSLRLNWGASAGDTGTSTSGLGGYLVVRGTSDPATVPLANATYRTNYNSSLGTGTVVYFGPTTVTSFTDTGLLPGTTYYYRVYAFDNALNYSSASKASAMTTYPPPPTAGALTVQPALPVCAGTPVILTETASGGATPYSYQWKRNDSVIDGATTSTLTVLDPKQGDTYSCAVRSSGGVDWAVSPGLQLIVSTPPEVSALPASLLGQEEGTVVLRVEASGEGLGYQWRKEGVAMPGATGAALTLSPLRLGDAGKYDVLVTSGACATNSTVLVLTVNQLPLAPTLKLSRARGISLKVSLAELLAGCTDPDHDSVSFLGVDQGQHGAQVSYDSTFIYYLPANDQDDVLSYRVGDSRGGSRNGRVEIAVVSEVVEARMISVLEGVVRVRFAGIPNHGFRVERSATASGGTWEPVGSGKVPAGGVFEFEDGAAPKAGAYYRLVVEPQ